MKTILKAILISGALYSTAASAYTADQCKLDGGTWTATVLNFGTCTFKIEAAKKIPVNTKDNITAERCKELKGTINAAGDCIVTTKNITDNKAPTNKL